MSSLNTLPLKKRSPCVSLNSSEKIERMHTAKILHELGNSSPFVGNKSIRVGKTNITKEPTSFSKDDSYSPTSNSAFISEQNNFNRNRINAMNVSDTPISFVESEESSFEGFRETFDHLNHLNHRSDLSKNHVVKDRIKNLCSMGFIDGNKMNFPIATNSVASYNLAFLHSLYTTMAPSQDIFPPLCYPITDNSLSIIQQNFGNNPKINSINCESPTSLGIPLKQSTRKRKVCRMDSCDESAAKRTPYCEKHAGPRKCESESCGKYAQGRTRFCISHGGGRRCLHPNCKKGARDKKYCASHGGGRRCRVEICQKLAVGSCDTCTAHGGGKRCQIETCAKSAQSSSSYCVRHGGGRKCVIKGCMKVQRGKTKLCMSHSTQQQVSETLLFNYITPHPILNINS